MARSDLILALVQAGADRDDLLFRRTVDAIVAEERAKKHFVFADKLRAKVDMRKRAELGQLGPRTEDLAFATSPRRSLSSLYLAEGVRESINEFVEEHQRAGLLRSHGLEPRNRILFTGAPGNGKTSLAEAIAESLSVPLYVVRYEGIIANLLGDTARRINALMGELATEHCVLFFDEFDAIAKFRGDENESGEIKRLVTAVLGHLDRLAPHVIVIAATNYPELLDRAIWRRFDLHIELDPPDSARLQEWLADFVTSFERPAKIDLANLAKTFQGRSYSDLEMFRTAVRRRFVLATPDRNLQQIIDGTLRLMDRRSATLETPGGSSDTNASNGTESRTTKTP